MRVRTLGGLEEAMSHSLMGERWGTTLERRRRRDTRGGRGMVTKWTVTSPSSEDLPLLLLLLLPLSEDAATDLLTVLMVARVAPGILGNVGTDEDDKRDEKVTPLGDSCCELCLWCTIRCLPPRRCRLSSAGVEGVERGVRVPGLVVVVLGGSGDDNNAVSVVDDGVI